MNVYIRYRFKNVQDAGAGDVWSYNPCYSFTENSCNDVAVSIHYILIVLLLHFQRQIFVCRLRPITCSSTSTRTCRNEDGYTNYWRLSLQSWVGTEISCYSVSTPFRNLQKSGRFTKTSINVFSITLIYFVFIGYHAWSFP